MPRPALPPDVSLLLWDLACCDAVIRDPEGVGRCPHCRANLDADDHALDCLVTRATAACERHGIEHSAAEV